MNDLKDALKLSSIPVLIASLCCLAPVILVFLALSTVAFAASLSNILDGQYRWAFILLGILALVVSLVLYFRKRGICTLDQAKKHRNEIINKSILTAIVAFVFYYLFFVVFLTWAGRTLGIWE